MGKFLARLAFAAPFILCTVLGAAGNAQAAGLSITIPTTATAPAVDGTLSDPVWQKAAKVQLTFDRQTHGDAAEPTTAYIITDGKALYIGFDATQTRAPIVANQRNNNTGVDTDDEVKIGLWPSGKNGVSYNFIATAIGTRYQGSTENLSYEPTWDAVGHVGQNKYIVTMRIPLSIMHGAAQNNWLINLTRYEVTTGSLYAWSGGPSFGGTTDQNFAMPLLDMPKSVGSRPQPRIGVYGLGSIASPVAGGSTSRTGADISIPITETTSLIAALHPDVSNVEQDQQTIAPTAFRRFFNETRPFFTQGANYYNYMECDACNAEQSLYSPAIPTPRDGYAIEGKQGPLTFAAFDAVGFSRTDAAQSVIFKNPSQNFYVSGQRVSVNGTSKSLPGPAFRDNTLQFATKLDDLHHKFVYANYGTESATSNWITDPGQATFQEIGAGFYGPNSFVGGGFRRIGAQYNPFDGFFTHAFDAAGNTTAMGGYGVFAQHTWIPTGGKFKSINVNLYNDSYHSATGLAQFDLNLQLDVTTRKQWEFVENTGSSYFMVNGQLTPVTQESTRLNYRPGTATPSSLQFFTGRYGPGRLDAWFRSTTIKVGQRGALSLEADDTRQYLDHPQSNGSSTNIQWLERASFAYQLDPNTSFAVGVRRFFGPPPTPNGGSTCTIARPGNPVALGYCPNVSFAFHRRLPHDELYIIYGDASQTITVPQFLVKFIHYWGAEKGT
ncbi:MAG: DUF5916 domain-containing protein [Candidatus Eremiobacteraeota bacterium]|nr:DUF5916 domain-containing protein [Candidatus Eremiobacteraeota bacterium]